MSRRGARTAALLLPAALLLHEAVYALVGGGILTAHHYLELAIPLVVTVACSLLLATALVPSLGAPGRRPGPYVPLILAAALAGVFAVQELTESLLLGGGAEAMFATLSVAWLVPPFALVLGALLTALIARLDRAQTRFAEMPSPSMPRRRTSAVAGLVGPLNRPVPAPRGLRFAFARRPPPAAAS